MAVFAAVGAEPDVARGGGLFFDRTQIGAQFLVIGDPDVPVLERRAEGISQCLLDRTRKLDPFHAVTAEPVGSAFRQLHPETGGIYTAPPHVRQFEKRIQDLLLCREFQPVQHDQASAQVAAALE